MQQDYINLLCLSVAHLATEVISLMICRGDPQIISSLHSVSVAYFIHVLSNSIHPFNGRAAIMLGFATHSSLLFLVTYERNLKIFQSIDH